MPQANHWDRRIEAGQRDVATHAPLLTPEEARQGVVSGRIRRILVISLTLTIVAFAVIYAVYS